MPRQARHDEGMGVTAMSACATSRISSGSRTSGGASPVIVTALTARAQPINVAPRIGVLVTAWLIVGAEPSSGSPQ